MCWKREGIGAGREGRKETAREAQTYEREERTNARDKIERKTTCGSLSDANIPKSTQAVHKQHGKHN